MITQSCAADINRSHTIASLIALLCLLTAMTVQAHAQTFTVLHNFTGGSDGGYPFAGLVMDRGGNLYGTTNGGGYSGAGCNAVPGCGVVYKLTRGLPNWAFTPLYTFKGYESFDGQNPFSRVVFGPDGALYGTTSSGGTGAGAGTVYRLAPKPTACAATRCSWLEKILYSFQAGSDGAGPFFGDVSFDGAGNIYGSTEGGGAGMCNDAPGCGTVYKLSYSGGSWSESILYRFSQGPIPGFLPYPGVILDSVGNLYGASTAVGAIFELTPSGGNWIPTTLTSFPDYHRDGSTPQGGLISDSAGNLYGTTSVGGPNGGGTVFELVRSGNQWALDTLYAFSYSGDCCVNSGPGPTSTLAMDASGNLYGTTMLEGDFGNGSVFKLIHSNGNWTLTTIHSFTGGTDGGQPLGQVTLGTDGTIYGTTSRGGSSVGSCYQGLGCGVAFEIEP